MAGHRASWCRSGLLMLVLMLAPSPGVCADGTPTSRHDQSAAPSPEYLLEIAAWIAERSALPMPDVLPRVVLVSPGPMLGAYARDVDSDRLSPVWSRPNVVAVYDWAHQTIHLPHDWSGTTAAEQSMVVHEMVHHMQHQGGVIFACPQAREEQAYALQAAWLEQAGEDLFTAFEMDAFTLIARTQCGF